jgi:hypothetical protein
MEYPTVTVIDKSANTNLRTTIVHEAGHNWFYGMLGSNERDHAWMDEGINTFYETKTSNAIKHDTSHGLKTGVDANLFYYQNVATGDDQAIDQTSANFTKINYGVDVYYKTTMMLNWLEKYMGDDFEAGMHDYYNTWRYRHPYPEDFRKCMQRHTSKSLDWFFDDILNTDKRINYKITKARVNGDSTRVTIRNVSGIPGPVLINAYYHDSLMAKVWSQPFDNTTTITLPSTAWNNLKVDKVVPDGKTQNDEYRRHSLFPHFGLGIRPLLGLNLADKDKVFIAPSWGSNVYDGTELGLVFHNLTLPENRFRFAVAPMYAFGSKNIVGTGSVGYVWYPDNLFKEVMLQADGKTFHDNETSVNLGSPLYAGYTKVAPSLCFTFNEHDPLSTVTRTLLLKGYSIMEQNINFGTDSLAKPTLSSQNNMYGLLRYKHENHRTYNPFGYAVEGQMGADFAKVTAEGNIRIDYNVKNKSLYIRGFVGEFIPVNNDPAVYSRYELNASYSGIDDYLYDGTYRGRNATSGIAAQQISMQEGGFKVPVFNGADRSDTWMATVNLETDLPLGKLPIRLFLDAGVIPNATPSITNASNSTVLYDGGIEVYLVKNICSVYFPLIMSNDFQNYIINNYGHKNLYTRSISFTFQLQNINWLKYPSTILKTATN